MSHGKKYIERSASTNVPVSKGHIQAFRISVVTAFIMSLSKLASEAENTKKAKKNNYLAIVEGKYTEYKTTANKNS